GARFVARMARYRVAASGRFALALTGGRTPLAVFDQLVSLDVPWEKTIVAQTDERAAPKGHAERNLTALEARLPAKISTPRSQVHLMPVDYPDLDDAAVQYAAQLAAALGRPPIFDLVLLGLGPD